MKFDISKIKNDTNNRTITSCTTLQIKKSIRKTAKNSPFFFLSLTNLSMILQLATIRGMGRQSRERRCIYRSSRCMWVMNFLCFHCSFSCIIFKNKKKCENKIGRFHLRGENKPPGPYIAEVLSISPDEIAPGGFCGVAAKFLSVT